MQESGRKEHLSKLNKEKTKKSIKKFKQTKRLLLGNVKEMDKCIAMVIERDRESQREREGHK